MYRSRLTINYKGLADGDTQLIKAAFYNAKEMAQKCIEYSANLNLQNNLGNTALIEAARHGHDDIIKILIRNKADLEIKNNKGNSAIIEAIKNGHQNTLVLLMQAGANIDIEKALAIVEYSKHKEVKNYLQEYATSVQKLTSDLQSKFIDHHEPQGTKNISSDSCLNYDYFSSPCNKIGISELSEANCAIIGATEV